MQFREYPVNFIELKIPIRPCEAIGSGWVEKMEENENTAVPTILIVEDQLDVRRLLELVFRTRGYRLLGAESGEEAVDMVRRHVPDVILLDIMLPGKIDGYEVARILKAEPATAGCAIIVMTAKIQKKDRDEAFAAGADDFIGKPFNMGELSRKVERFLAGKGRG